MNKLSKKERHLVYLLMLGEYEYLLGEHQGYTESFNCRRYDITLCDVYHNIFGQYPFIYPGSGNDFKYHLFKLYLPELFNKKPVRITSRYESWFPCNLRGYRKRINLLEQCVKETL